VTICTFFANVKQESFLKSKLKSKKPNQEKSMKVLILDKNTYGHQAAEEYLLSIGVDPQFAEFVFCGTHEEIVRRIKEQPSIAFIPVRNSTIGPITEHQLMVDQLLAQNPHIVQVGSFDLRIEHCLLVNDSVSGFASIGKIYTKTQAAQQCFNWLYNHWIMAEIIHTDSTQHAAEIVAKSDSSIVACIGSQSLASKTGLNILARNIQDNSDNTTEFAVLENRMSLGNITVGIIGHMGQSGSMLFDFCRKQGLFVAGSDSSTYNPMLVSNSDVVIFASPLDSTPQIIQELSDCFKPGQLVIEITSTKSKTVEALEKIKERVDISYVSMHIMSRPRDTIRGEKCVVCQRRLSAKWKQWFENFLKLSQMKICEMQGHQMHDRHMDIIQTNPHIGTLENALVARDSGIDISSITELASPFYQVSLAQIGRMIGKKPDVYVDIILNNPNTLESLKKRKAVLSKIEDLAKSHDREGLIKLFEDVSEYLGEDTIRDAEDLFTRIFEVLKNLHGEKSVIIECDISDNHSGLLLTLLEVFQRRSINLQSLTSVVLDERLQFAVRFEQSIESRLIRRALDEIVELKEANFRLIR
jgi:prephenate dehydratase